LSKLEIRHWVERIIQRQTDSHTNRPSS